jgi:uncharacterized pyridoxamine 5'-phosphate oxidase family protein
MSRLTNTLASFLKDLLKTQKLAVLATEDQNQPYGNLVAFAATNDLKYLVFATVRNTRKYANIINNPKVAMVIDNRSNRESDFHEAAAVTALGIVKEAKDVEKGRLEKLYLSKHPYLHEFITSPNCALLKIEVEVYYVVRRFQNVEEIRFKK